MRNINGTSYPLYDENVLYLNDWLKADYRPLKDNFYYNLREGGHAAEEIEALWTEVEEEFLAFCEEWGLEGRLR